MMIAKQLKTHQELVACEEVLSASDDATHLHDLPEGRAESVHAARGTLALLNGNGSVCDGRLAEHLPGIGVHRGRCIERLYKTSLTLET